MHDKRSLKAAYDKQLDSHIRNAPKDDENAVYDAYDFALFAGMFLVELGVLTEAQHKAAVQKAERLEKTHLFPYGATID